MSPKFAQASHADNEQCVSHDLHCDDFVCMRQRDVCVHKQAKETLAQQQPPEVRILKHLLSMRSPQERQTALQDAFAPGSDLQTEEQDLLST